MYSLNSKTLPCTLRPVSNPRFDWTRRLDSDAERQQQRREAERALAASQESLAELQADAAAARGAVEAAEARLAALQQEEQHLVALLKDCTQKKVSAR